VHDGFAPLEWLAMKDHNYYLGIINGLQEPILVIGKDFQVLDANEAAGQAYGRDVGDMVGLRCHDVTHHFNRPCHEEGMLCPVREVFLSGNSVRVVHEHKRSDGRSAWEEVVATPLRDSRGEVESVVEEIHDLTDTLKNEEIVKQLQAEVQTLQGLLPICSHCKKIRDADGQWNSVEKYIRHHSKAEFTHGVCPECLKKNYDSLDGGI
jgi:PAS domain S-box-containing protein